MKKFVISIFIVIVFSQLFGSFSLWNNIRNSSFTAEDSIYVRFETVAQNTKVHYKTSEGWDFKFQTDFNEITKQVILPYEQNDLFQYRLSTDSLGYFLGMPAKFDSDNMQSIDDFAHIGADEEGDVENPENDFQDITNQFFGFSDNKFFAAINTVGSGFPVMDSYSGPYYCYSAGIVNPETAAEDSIAYAMLYSLDMGTIISPGLYKISGSNYEGMSRIGDIEYLVDDDVLFMSCDIEDIVNDEDFGEWPNQSNSLMFSPINITINLPDEFTIADIGVPANLIFDQFFIEPYVNSLPEITNIHVTELYDSKLLSLTYSDLNNNFPIVRRVSLDNNEEFELIPTTFDFTEDVEFQAELPSESWENGVIVFSDNMNDLVQEEISNTAIQEEVTDSRISVYPNPINLNSLKVNFSIKNKFNQIMNIEIFNVKGQLVEEKKLNISRDLDDYSLELDKNTYSSGLYFMKLEKGNKSVVKKLIICD